MRDLFRALTLALGALAFGFSFLNCLADSSIQAIEDRIERFRKADRLHNVVKIVSEQGNGYGLIIGRQFDSLLVLTARHLLADAFVNERSKSVGDLVVRLYGVGADWRGKPGQVYELLPNDRVRDVAVVEVSVPNDPDLGEGNYLLADAWREIVIDADPDVGARVELAATVNEIGYAGGSAHISSTEHGRPVSIEGLEGQPGQSGAPVATDRGFVAMYLGSSAPQTVALLDIRDAIIDEFGAPLWGLLPVEPRSEPTRLCVRLQGAQVSEVSAFGPNGRVNLNERGCGESSTGLHSLSANALAMTCMPSKFVVTTNRGEPFEITCAVDPTGLWVASGQGTLELESVGKGEWRLRLYLPRTAVKSEAG